MTEPRETQRLFGHNAQQRAFSDAFSSGRIPHAWLLAGPEGIGKSTFAHLAARAVISRNAEFGHDSGDAVHVKIAEGNEPALSTITRGINEKTGKPRSTIPVEDIRDLKRALTFAPTEGGWRVVIADATEDMNTSAANALLKVLEEPPARVVFFLVSHVPRRLLPTILSRCRRLDFNALGDDELAAAYEAVAGEPPGAATIASARGSVGAALIFAALDGAVLQEALQAVLAPLPERIDRNALHVLADIAAASGKDDAFRTTAKLIADLSAGMATAASGADALPVGCERLSPLAAPGYAAQWADMTMRIAEFADRTLALNLDRRQALLDMVTGFEKVAKGTA